MGRNYTTNDDPTTEALNDYIPFFPAIQVKKRSSYKVSLVYRILFDACTNF